MSQIRFGRGRVYEFFRREDIKSRWDLESATRFLRGFRSDFSAMESFRSHVLSTVAVGSSGLTDEQVIASYARLLVSGDVVVAMPARERRLGHLSVVVPPEAAAAPAPAPATQQEEQEQPTFIDNHDGVAQAEVLITAARNASPLCEECQRIANQQMQGATA